MIQEIIIGISRGLALGTAGLIIFLHISTGKYLVPVMKWFEPVALAGYLICLMIWILSEQYTGETTWTG